MELSLIHDVNVDLEKTTMQVSEKHLRSVERSSAEEAIRSAYELRYRVYCLERGFLNADDYTECYEFDEHDSNAAHFYCFDADSKLVGYARLLNAESTKYFPFQKYCSVETESGALPDASRALEISRLMVREDYRRLRGNSGEVGCLNESFNISSIEKRRQTREILMNLFEQMYSYSQQNDISHWYAAMERPLARLLTRMNFLFKSIGPHSDYFGPVAPYLANLNDYEQLRRRMAA